SKIIRDANGKIKDENHTTIPFLTKYERTRVLGCRAKQINNNSDIFIKNDTNIINSYLIAKEELKQKKIPFIIQRPLPSGISEYWKVSDLELLDL
ncbi:DNA-directed RNA polymerase subunit omega, partial [bacterium]|nr:DNA-directed RNA polymerase subunit omega [bacterium]